MQVTDLVAKEMRPVAPAGASQPAEAAGTASEDFLYQTQWQAAASVQPTDNLRTQPSAHISLQESPIDMGLPITRYIAGRMVGLQIPDLPGKARLQVLAAGSQKLSAAEACTQLIQLWQQVSDKLVGGALELKTRGAFLAGGPSDSTPQVRSVANGSVSRLISEHFPSLHTDST